MTANQNELLSALVDGELKGNQLEQALKLLSTNELARAAFQRHQLVSDVLHGYVSQNHAVDLTGRIANALLDEPAITLPTKRKALVVTFPTPFWKQASGLALAASVGALAVMGVMNQSQIQSMPVTAVVSIEAPSKSMTVAQTGNRWTVSEQEVEERLNTYLVNHNEYAGASSVFSYARVVSHDAGQ